MKYDCIEYELQNLQLAASRDQVFFAGEGRISVMRGNFGNGAQSVA